MEWNWANRAKLRDLWAEGLSTAEIGRRLNCTKHCVIGRAHRDKLPPRPSPIRAADPDTARRRREKRALPEYRAKECTRHQEAAAKRRQAYFPPITDAPRAPGEETIRETARRLAQSEYRVQRLVETVPGLGRRASAARGSAGWRWLICDPSRMEELLNDQAEPAAGRVAVNPEHPLARGLVSFYVPPDDEQAADLNPFDPKHWWP